jgi:pimeloyl-ACP methyl ester carboxylesterase
VALAAAGLGAGVVALRRADARWAGATDPCAPADHEPLDGSPFSVTTSDGAVLAGGEAGEGPWVVLAHGWTNTGEVWRPVAHRLVAQGFRVAWYDQRGHGDSTVGRDGYGIDRLGADLGEVMAQRDARDAVVVGHSMGGMTVQALATYAPQEFAARVRGALLVATASTGLSRGHFDAQAVALMGSALPALAVASPLGLALVRGTVGATVVRDHVVRVRDWFLHTPAATRREFLRSMLAMDLTQGIATIAVPTTVMVGTRDRTTPPRLSEQIAEAIPGARLVRSEGHGHMLPLEAPDEVVAEIVRLAA